MKTSMRERREAAGLTQADVAKLLGMSGAQYSRYEKVPGSMTLAMASKVATILGCSPSDILGTSTVSGVSLVELRRAVPIFDMEDVSMGLTADTDIRPSGTYAPAIEVSADAFAIAMPDRSMEGGDPRTLIFQGDLVCIDPTRRPVAGNVVAAIDPSTGAAVVRLFYPLHPTDPRAPGFTLRAHNPAFPDIFVTGSDGIVGVVVERKASLV